MRSKSEESAFVVRRTDSSLLTALGSEPGLLALFLLVIAAFFLLAQFLRRAVGGRRELRVLEAEPRRGAGTARQLVAGQGYKTPQRHHGHSQPLRLGLHGRDFLHNLGLVVETAVALPNGNVAGELRLLAED